MLKVSTEFIECSKCFMKLVSDLEYWFDLIPKLNIYKYLTLVHLFFNYKKNLIISYSKIFKKKNDQELASNCPIIIKFTLDFNIFVELFHPFTITIDS